MYFLSTAITTTNDSTEITTRIFMSKESMQKAYDNEIALWDENFLKFLEENHDYDSNKGLPCFEHTHRIQESDFELIRTSFTDGFNYYLSESDSSYTEEVAICFGKTQVIA